MAQSIKMRTVKPKAFLKANEVEISELPRKLDSLKEYVFQAIENDCRRFAEQISIWKGDKLYEYFEPTWEQFIERRFKQPIEWVDLMLEGWEILQNPTSESPRVTQDGDDYTADVHRAIEKLQRQIDELTHLGIRLGCVLESSSGGKPQYHWAANGKRQYLKKSLVEQYQQECDRNRQVQQLTKRVESLKNALP